MARLHWALSLCRPWAPHVHHLSQTFPCPLSGHDCNPGTCPPVPTTGPAAQPEHKKWASEAVNLKGQEAREQLCHQVRPVGKRGHMGDLESVPCRQQKSVRKKPKGNSVSNTGGKTGAHGPKMPFTQATVLRYSPEDGIEEHPVGRPLRPLPVSLSVPCRVLGETLEVEHILFTPSQGR